MRSGGKGVRIVPRVLFEGWSLNNFQELFASESKRTELAEFLGDNLSVRTFETFALTSFLVLRRSDRSRMLWSFLETSV